MSNPRDDHYYHPATTSKSSKTPPVGESQSSSAFFQTGQAPVSSFSNQYAQPRSSPSRYDCTPPVYQQWVPSANNPASTPLTTSFGYYDTHDSRYATQDYYSTYSSTSRPTVTSSDAPVAGSRKLPPLNTSPTPGSRDERWNSTSYQQSGFAPIPGSDVRPSSNSSYSTSYGPYNTSTSSASAFNYDIPLDGRSPHIPHSFTPNQSASPQLSHPSYSPPPVSPTTATAEEPTIKKKRKRADAQQLKILNETYARTPFPSTEERLALAKLLDMSARSVQIWFQNKRQSMRQTRQTSTSAMSQSHQGYTLTSQNDLVGEDSIRTGGYEPSGGQTHVPRSTQDIHLSPSLTSSHRRPFTRPQEGVSVDSRKPWQGRSY
ncbi:hypothetical protein PM082_001628 [Marasmius tenuissimus]|nr:hypothetical protein PM082_001628 [Marasmius tenuissimus]